MDFDILYMVLLVFIWVDISYDLKMEKVALAKCDFVNCSCCIWKTT